MLDKDRIIAALYQFKSLDRLEERKKELYDFCVENDILGTLILGNEGINGTIVGSRKGIDNVKKFLENWGFTDMEYKESHPPKGLRVFYRMKVKLKKEIPQKYLTAFDLTERIKHLAIHVVHSHLFISELLFKCIY